MRGAMIAVGAKLIAEFHWILYVFGVFLIVTGIKMLILKTDHTDPNQNIIVRLTRRFFPITSRFHGQHFAVRAGAPASYESEFPGTASLPDEVVNQARPGTLLLTPLALALICGRVYGPGFCGGLHPGDFRYYSRSVPGVYE
jgi:tellurite resistance protein TerC